MNTADESTTAQTAKSAKISDETLKSSFKGALTSGVSLKSMSQSVSSSKDANVWVDACDLSGYRQPNAIVDTGYGDRGELISWGYSPCKTCKP